MNTYTMLFEIVSYSSKDNENVYNAESCGETVHFRPVNLSEKAIQSLEKDMEKWEIISKYSWNKENLAYNDYKSDSGERVIPYNSVVSFLAGSVSSSQLRGGFLIDKGVFVGVILYLTYTNSFGMSCSIDEKLGVLMTDGRTFGRTSKHYSHCSTEIDESLDSRTSFVAKKHIRQISRFLILTVQISSVKIYLHDNGGEL